MTSDNLNLSRREALAALGLMAISCGTTLGADPEKAAANPQGRIALQLYTLREPAKKDLAGTLKKARAMGWEYVQWSGMPDLPADKIRAALDTAGLKAIAAHITVEPFEKNFQENVRFWKTVGVADVALSTMMKDCKADLEGWLRGCKRIDVLGAKLRDAGMRFAYHNHNLEFEKFPGETRCKLDILLESTKPENVKAEFDLAWVFIGGADPATYIRKYKGRCPFVHAKDTVAAKNDAGGKKGGKFRFKPLGQGALNWKEIFAAGREAGIEWYIYEQDNGEGSPFEYASASHEFLLKNPPNG